VWSYSIFSQMCRKIKFSINFEHDFGWRFIRAPLDIDADYCTGACFQQDGNLRFDDRFQQELRDHLRLHRNLNPEPCWKGTAIPLDLFFNLTLLLFNKLIFWILFLVSKLSHSAKVGVMNVIISKNGKWKVKKLRGVVIKKCSCN